MSHPSADSVVGVAGTNACIRWVGSGRDNRRRKRHNTFIHTYTGGCGRRSPNAQGRTLRMGYPRPWPTASISHRRRRGRRSIGGEQQVQGRPSSTGACMEGVDRNRKGCSDRSIAMNTSHLLNVRYAPRMYAHDTVPDRAWADSLVQGGLALQAAHPYRLADGYERRATLGTSMTNIHNIRIKAWTHLSFITRTPGERPAWPCGRWGTRRRRWRVSQSRNGLVQLSITGAIGKHKPLLLA